MSTVILSRSVSLWDIVAKPKGHSVFGVLRLCVSLPGGLQWQVAGARIPGA